MHHHTKKDFKEYSSSSNAISSPSPKKGFCAKCLAKLPDAAAGADDEPTAAAAAAAVAGILPPAEGGGEDAPASSSSPMRPSHPAGAWGGRDANELPSRIFTALLRGSVHRTRCAAASEVHGAVAALP